MTRDETPVSNSRRFPGSSPSTRQLGASGEAQPVTVAGVLSSRGRQHRRVPALLRAAAVVTAALLLVDAYVHLHDASLYDAVSTVTLSQATLFRGQAAAAVVAAIGLLIWPRPAIWVIAALVAGTAAVAVLLYTNVNVGELGPLPNMYEPTWVLPGKRASAAAETAGTVLAVGGLILSLVTRSGETASAKPAGLRS